jgi:hypothetical protein
MATDLYDKIEYAGRVVSPEAINDRFQRISGIVNSLDDENFASDANILSEHMTLSGGILSLTWSNPTLVVAAPTIILEHIVREDGFLFDTTLMVVGLAATNPVTLSILRRPVGGGPDIIVDTIVVNNRGIAISGVSSFLVVGDILIFMLDSINPTFSIPSIVATIQQSLTAD